MVWLISDVLQRIQKGKINPLPAPDYTPTEVANNSELRIGLAVPSMKAHTTDEGWQIFAGLASDGYELFGHKLPSPDCPTGCTDVAKIVQFNPVTMVVQDKREWEGITAGKGFDQKERFTNVEVLQSRPDIFKGTIIKDSQSNPPYHCASAEEMQVHFHICYYSPRIVNHLASYTRPQHLVRTWHTIDSDLTPRINSLKLRQKRKGCILSGAISNAYPLRQRLSRFIRYLPETTHVQHPGYRRDGCHTPIFLQTLSTFKVAICTASVFGYALRKIVEATACGCVVITDLPHDEVIPEIDGNLVRIHPDSQVAEVAATIRRTIAEYDFDKQVHYSDLARLRFDYRVECMRLAREIEKLRRNYNNVEESAIHG